MSQSNSTINTINYPTSVFSGAMIIASTAIGAGMLALPVVMSGAWLWWALAILILTWFCMYNSGLMILEANLNYHIGASFDTVVKDLLGNSVNVINGLTIAFVLYILEYAYVSASGGGLSYAVASLGLAIPSNLAGLICASAIAAIVWISSTAVNRIAAVLMLAKMLAFALAMLSFYAKTDPVILFNTNEIDASYFPFAFVALPVCLASFGYHGNVPSLMKHYGKNPAVITKCIFYGSVTALLIYICWIIAVMGVVPRFEFKAIMAAGGNLDAILAKIHHLGRSDLLNWLLTFFANFAIISSFLGVSLGLFDYISDLFGFSDDSVGRSQAACITFVPPMIAGYLWPNGFVYAIGFAGLAATVWAVIVPACLAVASRRKFKQQSYQVKGGWMMIGLIILFGLTNAAVQILASFNLLPSYY